MAGNQIPQLLLEDEFAAPGNVLDYILPASQLELSDRAKRHVPYRSIDDVFRDDLTQNVDMEDAIPGTDVVDDEDVDMDANDDNQSIVASDTSEDQDAMDEDEDAGAVSEGGSEPLEIAD